MSDWNKLCRAFRKGRDVVLDPLRAELRDQLKQYGITDSSDYGQFIEALARALGKIDALETQVRGLIAREHERVE